MLSQQWSRRRSAVEKTGDDWLMFAGARGRRLRTSAHRSLSGQSGGHLFAASFTACDAIRGQRRRRAESIPRPCQEPERSRQRIRDVTHPPVSVRCYPGGRGGRQSTLTCPWPLPDCRLPTSRRARRAAQATKATISVPAASTPASMRLPCLVIPPIPTSGAAVSV